MSGRFVPGIVPPGITPPEALCFLFRGASLAVRRLPEGALVPRAAELDLNQLAPQRSQYLGRFDGLPCVSFELAPDRPAPPGLELAELRGLWGALPEAEFWLAGRAFQIMDWDRTHLFCGRCGTPTRAKSDERAKLCPACGLTSFPRVAPAIIMAVVREGTILLARARRFPTAMYSVIAGFVDPGESLEECAHREVREEVGLSVRNLRYFASQPWPFPHSLMVAFTAEHAAGEITVDGREIVDAGWYPPERLPRIPDRISVARRLIDWFVETHPPDGRA
jgi:NAD+ diphosphatase